VNGRGSGYETEMKGEGKHGGRTGKTMNNLFSKRGKSGRYEEARRDRRAKEMGYRMGRGRRR
jgi:hypothetical protein